LTDIRFAAPQGLPPGQFHMQPQNAPPAPQLQHAKLLGPIQLTESLGWQSISPLKHPQ
jgi:hypothetical protein